MDKPDGFWNKNAISDKGWKTRRAQQDAYRKALDEQIQQRKALDMKRLDKAIDPARPSSTPPADPVRHLMPWLNASNDPKRVVGGGDQPNKATSNKTSGPAQVDKAHAVVPANLPPPEAYGHNQPSDYYFATQPTGAAGAKSGNAQIGPAVGNANIPVPVQHHPQRNVAYGYYNTPAIPPPAGFVQNSHVQMAPGYLPYNHPCQVAQTPNVVPTMAPQLPYNHPCQQVLQNPNVVPTMASHPKTLSAPEGPSAEEQAMIAELTKELQNYNASDPQLKMESGRSQDARTEAKVKRHVSQTSEESPDASQMKYDYRDELRRQIEERRKLEEDRKVQEKLEEELLQRKVREDQERMKREYEEEERRRKDKEEEKRQKELEILQHTKEIQEQEKARRKQEKEIQRKKKEEKLKAELEEAKPIVVNIIDNPFDDTPLPISLPQKEKDGNEIESFRKQQHANPPEQMYQPQPLGRTRYVEFEASKTTPNAKSSSRTKKSGRKLLYPSNIDTKGGGDGDAKMCPRCSAPYFSEVSEDAVASSVQQAHRSRSLEEQEEGLRFFTSLKSSLEAERQRIEQNLKETKFDQSYICSITCDEPLEFRTFK